MRQSAVYQLVLAVVRGVARGRPVASRTRFSQIGIGRWQRQRFFGPLREAFNRHGLEISGGGLEQGSFTRFDSLRQVQAAVWQIIKDLNPTAIPIRQRADALTGTGESRPLA